MMALKLVHLTPKTRSWFRLISVLLWGWLGISFESVAVCQKSVVSHPLQRLSIGSMERVYRVHVPPGYQDGTHHPVVLMLHGWGGDEHTHDPASWWPFGSRPRHVARVGRATETTKPTVCYRAADEAKTSKRTACWRARGAKVLKYEAWASAKTIQRKEEQRQSEKGKERQYQASRPRKRHAEKSATVLWPHAVQLHMPPT